MWKSSSRRVGFHGLLMLCAMLYSVTGHAQRALWIWEKDSYAMLQNPRQAQVTIDFLRKKNINTLYMYADAHDGKQLLTDDPQSYERLIRQLHAQNIQVHALLGSSPLHTERYVLPEFRGPALAMVQRVLDYNRSVAAEARFDGINLDIEPHVLNDWATRREALINGFLDVSEAYMALKRKANLPLQIGPALPFWFDGVRIQRGGKTRPASEFFQDIYDHIVLMDYRNRSEGPDGIISHAEDEIAYANKIGKTVLIGLETAQNDLKKLTFHDLREADLEREITATQRAFQTNRGFGGIVIHHYASYRNWLRGQGLGR